MPTVAPPKSSRDKVRAHRQRMRRKGMRLIQKWVPETRTSAFTRQARQASLAVSRGAHAEDDQAFVDAVSVWRFE